MTFSNLDPATIDCVTACVNGCVLGDRCPHREAAKAAIAYVNETDWDTLMEKAESRFAQPDPLSVLDSFKVGGSES